MRLIGLVGLAVIMLIAWAFSSDRRAVSWRTVGWGLALQFGFAVFVLKTSVGIGLFAWLSDGATQMMLLADTGGRFVFGEVANEKSFGFIFAFKALPLIIFVSSLFSVLYYFGILQWVVLMMARVMARTMGTSGAESLSGAANIFLGHTEAPLLIVPFIPRMTRSELAAVMIVGMGTISAPVLGAFVAMGIEAKYLIAASVMNAPAGFVIAKILVPETGEPLTRGSVKLDVERSAVNVIDAAAQGAATGMKLSLNIAAMLIAFLFLIALINWPLSSVGLSLEGIFSWGFSPLAFLIGVPWDEAGRVGLLLGNKLALNEFVAYAELSKLLQDGLISERTELIATFALCSFANFASIGIQIGGIGSIAPTRQSDIAELGLKACLGGFLTTLMAASVAGLLA